MVSQMVIKKWFRLGLVGLLDWFFLVWELGLCGILWARKGIDVASLHVI